MFTRQKKEEIVQELADIFSNASLILFTDYRGLSVKQISDLRQELYKRYSDQARYRVSKNSLVRLALEKAGFDEENWNNEVVGTTAIMTVVKDDPIDALKIFANFAKANKLPELRGGYLEGRYFEASRVTELARLPTREELISMVVRGFAAPITGLAYSLNGVLTKFLYALNAITEKKAD